MKRARSWCFTVNNDTYEDFETFMSHTFKYCIIGFEVGEEGTPHMQGYVQYHEAKSLKKMKKILPRAHLEIAKGNAEQNRKYCSKEGDYYEIGSYTSGGKVTFDQLTEAYENPAENITLLRLYSRAYKEVRQLMISRSSIATMFFRILDTGDFMSEIMAFLGADAAEYEQDSIVCITDLAELGGYETVPIHTVVYYPDWPGRLLNYYPGGVPIRYKYGYEYHTVKPKNFIVVCNQGLFSQLTKYSNLPWLAEFSSEE